MFLRNCKCQHHTPTLRPPCCCATSGWHLLNDCSRLLSPLVQCLEQRLVSRQVRQFALGHGDVLAADIGLEVTLAHVGQQSAEAVCQVALSPDVCVCKGQQTCYTKQRRNGEPTAVLAAEPAARMDLQMKRFHQLFYILGIQRCQHKNGRFNKPATHVK